MAKFARMARIVSIACFGLLVLAMFVDAWFGPSLMMPAQVYMSLAVTMAFAIAIDRNWGDY